MSDRANIVDWTAVPTALTAPLWLSDVQFYIGLILAALGVVLMFYRIRIARKEVKILDRKLEKGI